ncbi:MarR family transcriptional regulator [Imperialibacter roseus]|uniref:MarR family transcriptional regulator n=1 Tax=Imperialibacter roseus TaxID=1324217 RepID=A0ABZ0ITV5_9BACT|nr:MarR family transcriptional regulator [Imperialibacter roseus]WOK07947.1 MarR family transcriptional regulator [Imperialibacter roseus]
MKTPNSLEENLLFQISEVAKLLHKRLTIAFEEGGFDVTPEQFSILALLWYKEGINQQDIANELRRDKTTIARIISNMINRNLIIKIPDQLDKRNNLIYLTKKGKELQTEMVATSGKVYVQTMQRLSAKDVAVSLSVLKQITKNFE